MSEPVMRHEKQHTRGCGDARERASEQTDKRKHVDQQTEDRGAGNDGKDAHRGLTLTKILSGNAEAEDFSVRADDKKSTRNDGALNDGAWNRFERIARLGTERGGAFESDEA